jgi:hypothetical protein
MTGFSCPDAMRPFRVSTSGRCIGFHHSRRPLHLSLNREISGPITRDAKMLPVSPPIVT